MLAIIKYLMDENVDIAYCKQMRRRKPDLTIRAIGEPGIPPKKTPDPDILLWCEAYDFILVTNNRASMPVHLADRINQGRHIPGIFILNSDLSIGQNSVRDKKQGEGLQNVTGKGFHRKLPHDL